MDLLFLTVLDGGYMDHCKVKIPASSAGAGAPEFEADCSVANGERVFTNNPNLNQLILDWKAVWDLPLDTPTVPSHVVESEPGIVKSEVDLFLLDAGMPSQTHVSH